MALIDLKSNLKDLSFVDPNFRNTKGGAPYVYKDHTDYEANPSKLKSSNEIQARIDETVRIAKLLVDNPGLKFAGKQAAILAAKNLLEDSRLGLIEVGREVVSLLASAVAQVPVNGTGVHFDKYELYERGYYLRKSAYEDALYRGKIEDLKDRDPSTDINDTRASNEIDQRDNSLFNRDLTNSPFNLKITGSANYLELDRDSDLTDPNKNTTEAGRKARSGNTITIDTTKPEWTISLDYDYELSTNAIITDPEKDLVPVRLIPADGGLVDDGVLFRGFITNISDNTSPNFNSYNFVGRGEPVFTYMNTSRTLGFNLQVPIFNENEQGLAYERANRLISYGYSAYNESGLPVGTLLKIQVGNLFNHYGVPTNISHTVETNVPWSIGDTDVLLPQVLSFSLSFNIIHKKLPNRATRTSDFQEYIGKDLFAFNPYQTNVQ